MARQQSEEHQLKQHLLTLPLQELQQRAQDEANIEPADIEQAMYCDEQTSIKTGLIDLIVAAAAVTEGRGQEEGGRARETHSEVRFVMRQYLL